MSAFGYAAMLVGTAIFVVAVARHGTGGPLYLIDLLWVAVLFFGFGVVVATS